MATQKQVNANRQNAQKSTGPRTAEGKATVSKNAVKHGLFAAEAVINGENPADYEAFHNSLLAEMAPDGIVETLLAERVVNLWWRLRRAERMQNQTIDRMIEYEVTSPLARHIQKLYCQAEGIKGNDKRHSPDHLPLGRISWKDFSNDRTLDRMMLYERRIENSMTRMLREFKKQQIMRRIEQQDISYDQAVGGTEALIGKKVDLKKQTQFVPGSMGVSPFAKGDYDNIPAGGIEENKANQSQFHAPTRQKGAVKKEKLPTAAKSLAG